MKVANLTSRSSARMCDVQRHVKHQFDKFHKALTDRKKKLKKTGKQK